MESITIGQIALIIAFIVGFIKGIEYLYGLISKGSRKWVKSVLEPILEPINEKLDTIDKKTDSIDLGSCKNFLVRFLKDIEQGNKVDEVEIERFYEIYEHYTKLGGNSYIHDKVEKLKKENKL